MDEIEDWLKKLEIWQCVIDTEETKQGPAVYVTVTGLESRTTWLSVCLRTKWFWVRV